MQKCNTNWMSDLLKINAHCYKKLSCFSFPSENYIIKDGKFNKGKENFCLRPQRFLIFPMPENLSGPWKKAFFHSTWHAGKVFRSLMWDLFYAGKSWSMELRRPGLALGTRLFQITCGQQFRSRTGRPARDPGVRDRPRRPRISRTVHHSATRSNFNRFASLCLALRLTSSVARWWQEFTAAFF
jgi:hypothetical protein